MKACICFLSWNRWEYTKKSIQSILDNTDRSNYDLIWWDNGSTENGMVNWIKNICEQNSFYYLLFKRNEGLTRAMNNQMHIMNKQNYYDTFCHISNDIVVPNNWLNGVFDAIATQKVGVVGLKMNGDTNTILEKVVINNVELEKIKDDGNVGGMHFCIAKWIYDILGNFEHVPYGYGQQDANYCLQVKLLPLDVWVYYLPLEKFKGDDLSFSWPIFDSYEKARTIRLKKSASDEKAGRKYRNCLRQFRKNYDEKLINDTTLINLLKTKESLLNLDKSQLLETNIKEL